MHGQFYVPLRTIVIKDDGADILSVPLNHQADERWGNVKAQSFYDVFPGSLVVLPNQADCRSRTGFRSGSNERPG